MTRMIGPGRIGNVFILATLLLTLAAPVGASAGQTPGQFQARFTLADLGKGEIVARSVFDQAAVHLVIPEGWQVQQIRLRLDLAHGKSLLDDQSDLTFFLNQAPAGQLILNRENAGPGWVEVDLPAELLQAGDNTLLFRFHQRLQEQGCADAGKAGLWVRIKADSEIELEGQEIPLEADLSRWPAPFATLGAATGPGISIILPEQPTAAELTAAARIAAALGQAGQWAQPPLRVLVWNQLDEQADDDHWIVVAETGRLPLADVPGLVERAAPNNRNRLALVVSGRNENELLAAADLLSTRSVRSRLQQTATLLQPVTPRPPVELPAQTTLAGLGWEDRHVRGIGTHDLYYPIDLPYDWRLTNEAAIELHFAHARSLASTTSLMAVFINGFKVADVQLAGRNAEQGRLTIQLSPRQVHPGRNWLHLAFELHVRREDCRYRYLEEAWATISSLSTLKLAHVGAAPPLDLRYLPAPMLVPADLSGDLFVLPDEPGPADLTAMVRLAAKLGSYTDADGLRPRAVTAGHFNLDEATRDTAIVLGSPENNALLARYDGQIPQPLARREGTIQPAGGRELTPAEESGQASYLEILPAPWSRRATLVVLGAFDGEQLLSTVKAMPARRDDLTVRGNVAVITDGGLVGLEMSGLAGAALSPRVRLTMALVLIGAVLVTGSAGLLMARRRRVSKVSEEQDYVGH